MLQVALIQSRLETDAKRACEACEVLDVCTVDGSQGRCVHTSALQCF